MHQKNKQRQKAIQIEWRFQIFLYEVYTQHSECNDLRNIHYRKRLNLRLPHEIIGETDDSEQHVEAKQRPEAFPSNL
ncbi:hypothetical protein D3C75_1283640 [compost metagenome]